MKFFCVNPKKVFACCLWFVMTGSIYPVAPQTRPDKTKAAMTKKEPSQVPCKCVQNLPSKHPDSSLLCGPEKLLLDSATDLPPNIVELRVVANKKGKVIVVEPISGDPARYEEAVKTIKRRRFKPKTLSGRPVKNEMIIKFVFRPSGASSPAKPKP